MAGNHARIAPSSLALTVACNAWVGLAEGLPPEADTEETLEGNAADWVVKQYAAGVEVPHGAVIPLPGDFKVDYDMIHGARLWASTVGYGAISGVPVVIERIHPTDCWGEPDGWMWNPIASVLKIPDYKYGFGLIDEFENWQLIAYAVGLIDTLGLTDSEVNVELTVVQPRAFHPRGPVRTWSVKGDDLRAYANIAWNAAIRALPTVGQGGDSIPRPPAQTGTHCIHCPARGVCHVFQNAISQMVEYSGSAERVAMDPNGVGVELAMIQQAMKMLEGRETALKAQAEAFIRGGQRVVNYCMEATTNHRAWNAGVTEAEIIGLGNVFKKDLRKPPAGLNSRNGPVVTPTQAIKAGIDEAVISQYASRPAGAMKLARDSLTNARRAFGANDQ